MKSSVVPDEEYSPFEQLQEANEAIARVQAAYIEDTIGTDQLDQRIAAILRDDAIDWEVRRKADDGDLEAAIEVDIKRHSPAKPSV